MHRRRSCIETLENRRLLAAVPIRMIDGEPIATIEWQGEQREMFAGRWMVQLEGYQGNLLEQQARAQQTINAANRGLSVVRRQPQLRKADRMKTSIFSHAVLDGTKLTAPGGAVRSGGHWYALNFTCDLTGDWMKATSFSFKLGPEIPQTNWEQLGLWR